MTTIRIAVRRKYVQLDSRAVNDDRLSFRARGVLAWLLEKPDNWRADARSIARRGKEGRDAVLTALQELEDAGYLRRVKIQDGTGRWSTECVLYEHPLEATESGKPGPGKPDPGEPGAIAITQDLELRLSPAGGEHDDEHADEVPAFDEWWDLYPRKLAKAAARKAWKSVTAPGPVLEGTRGWLAYWERERTETRFMPYPATFLNQRRWEETPELSPSSASSDGMVFRDGQWYQAGVG